MQALVAILHKEDAGDDQGDGERDAQHQENPRPHAPGKLFLNGQRRHRRFGDVA